MEKQAGATGKPLDFSKEGETSDFFVGVTTEPFADNKNFGSKHSDDFKGINYGDSIRLEMDVDNLKLHVYFGDTLTRTDLLPTKGKYYPLFNLSGKNVTVRVTKVAVTLFR